MYTPLPGNGEWGSGDRENLSRKARRRQANGGCFEYEPGLAMRLVDIVILPGYNDDVER